MTPRRSSDTWTELLRTASLVRAEALPALAPDGPSPWARFARPILLGAVVVAGVAFAVTNVLHSSVRVTADSGLDSRLFSLTNQDRASNGVGSMTHNGTLQNIGEGAHYNGCASGGVNGRSVDMIQRGYFSHQIPPCNMYVFTMMRAFGINYRSAGENIGWESGSGDPAGYVNTQFMNSPDHRANILNGNYTDLGIGSAFSGGANGCCGGNANDWMFSEEFAQLSSPPPPPPPPPPPQSTKQISGGQGFGCIPHLSGWSMTVANGMPSQYRALKK
jgi:uncharacterized protein YkwD